MTEVSISARVDFASVFRLLFDVCRASSLLQLGKPCQIKSPLALDPISRVTSADLSVCQSLQLNPQT